MTAQDWPDWSQQVFSGLRYLGAFSAGSGQLVALLPMDRCLIIVPPNDTAAANPAHIQVDSVTNISVYDSDARAGQPALVYVNPLSDANWKLNLTSGVGSLNSWYVFVDTAPYITDLARIGQQLARHSFPVVLPSDQSAIPVTSTQLPAALVGGRLDTNIGAWLGSTAPSVGAKVQASSLPVVGPTNGFGPGASWRMPYDAMLNHVPAAATKATVTFPATTNRRWVLDLATWLLYSTAAAATQQAVTVLDGATLIYASTLVIPATASVDDRLSIGPNLGLSGTLGAALTVEFTAAGPANTVERVTAGAYLLPLGV